MYGTNFEKQNSKLEEEINDYKNLRRDLEIEIKEKEQKIIQEENKIINQKSKKELEVMEKSFEIPTNLMTRFKSEAERLYPGNYYEQKRYMESSIGNYQYYKTIK
ncbi:MAG: hypothetical protein ACRDB2_06735, partial [Fusobacteriaceae bacterium]